MQFTRYTVESPRSPIVISLPSSIGARVGGRWTVAVREQVLLKGRMWFGDAKPLIDGLREIYEKLSHTPGYGMEAEDLRRLVAIIDRP